MKILVNRQRLDPMVSSESTLQQPLQPPPVTDEEINSEVELLQSADLLREVVLANGLQDREKTTPSALLLSRGQNDWYVAKAAERLSKKLDIDVVTRTNVIKVSYKSSDPQIAYGVLKKLADLYMQKHIAVQRPTGAYEFFAKETDKYRQSLADSEQRLANFGKQQGIVAPDIERTDMAQQVVNSIASLHQAQQAIAADEQRIQADESQLKVTPARSSTAEVSNDADLLLQPLLADRKSTRLNSSHANISYAVFCLK